MKIRKKRERAKVKAYVANNLLTISLDGRFNEKDGLRLEKTVEEKLPMLTHGFRLLNDMTKLKEMAPQAYSSHQRIMNMCDMAGVTKIARVYGKKSEKTEFNIMTDFYYDNKVGIGSFNTVPDALDYLLKQ